MADVDLIAVPARVVRVDRETFVVIRSEDGRTKTVSSVEVALCDALRIPCTAPGLAGRLMEEGWDVPALGQIPGLLDGLKDRGLVAELDAWISRFAKDDTEPAPGISALAVPTRDRPEMLDRALEAWVRNLHDRGAPDIVIADDSDRRTAEARAVVEKHASPYPGRMYALDRAFRNKLAERLPPGVLRALDRHDGSGDSGTAVWAGMNRNTILLALAGRTVMTVDDDVIPEYRELPDTDPGVVVCKDDRPQRILPAAGFPECRDLGRPSAHDGFDLHAALLGRSLRGLLSSEGLRFESAVDPDFYARFLSESSRVSAVVSGLWGDLGASAPFYLLDARHSANGESFDDEQYRAYAESTTGMRGVRTTTVGAGTFMAGQASFDARSLVPPFSPRGRNQDGLWGVCLRALHPVRPAAYPSVLIEHSPQNDRKPHRDALVRWNLRLNDLLILLVSSLSGDLRPREDRYGVLGSRLVDLGSGPRGELRACLAEMASHAFAGRIAVLMEQYDRFSGQPAAWGDDCITAIEYAKARLTKPGFWLPADGPQDEDSLAGYLRSFGEILSAWPAAFEAAAEWAGELLETARVK